MGTEVILATQFFTSMISKPLPSIAEIDSLYSLLDCGADEVIPDTVESSIMLARHTLKALGEQEDEISDMLDEAREGHYARIRAYFHSLDDVDLRTSDNHRLHSIEMLPSYHAVGKPIGELNIQEQISIIGLRRNALHHPA